MCTRTLPAARRQNTSPTIMHRKTKTDERLITVSFGGQRRLSDLDSLVDMYSEPRSRLEVTGTISMRRVFGLTLPTYWTGSLVDMQR